MSEDKLKDLLQQDQNLRDAIRQEEAERPQMPADLNARLMQRVSASSGSADRNKRSLWPWIAAACVAGIMVVFLTPPKETEGKKKNVAKVERKVIVKKKEIKSAIPAKKDPETKPVTPIKRKKQKERKPITPIDPPQQLLAQETQQPETVKVEKEAAKGTAPVTLTERDLPITRPENYHYTPEEIALMKKQAAKAYLKWVELELEIAKHSQEQTAQQ